MSGRRFPIRTFLAVSAAALAGLAFAGPAAARGGSSSSGDSYLNDAVRNPRFIEPGGDYLPSRYRESHPQAGYDDRQAIEAARQGYRGRVNVRPYRGE